MTPASTSASALSPLDDAIERTSARLEDAGVPAAEALFLMATGVDLFADNLHDVVAFELEEFAEVPEPWSSQTLVTGVLGELRVWLLDDVSAEPVPGTGSRPWHAGFPVWLAAANGAGVCVHTSAGSALPDEEDATVLPAGGFAVVRDHINVSGTNPLLGLGESLQGPLFPDQGHVHHLGLRRAALERGERLGLAMAEAIAACTAGPTLETAAERRMLARLGAEVSVQGLATPLIAAAHTGLAVLAIVAVTDTSSAETADVARLLEHAAAAQPALEDLLAGSTEDLRAALRARREEER